jgi:hypothetical protein
MIFYYFIQLVNLLLLHVDFILLITFLLITIYPIRLFMTETKRINLIHFEIKDSFNLIK